MKKIADIGFKGQRTFSDDEIGHVEENWDILILVENDFLGGDRIYFD